MLIDGSLFIFIIQLTTVDTCKTDRWDTARLITSPNTDLNKITVHRYIRISTLAAYLIFGPSG